MIAALYYPVFLALLFLAIGSVIEWWQRRHGIDGYACARCRYPVVGLDGPTCPECGSDLDARGILAPGWQPWWKVGARTIVLTMLALAVFVVLARAWPVRTTEIVVSRVSLSETRGPFVAIALPRRTSFPGWPDVLLAAAVLVVWIVLVHRLWTGPSRRRLRWDDRKAERAG